MKKLITFPALPYKLRKLADTVTGLDTGGMLTAAQSERFIDILRTIPAVTHRACMVDEDGWLFVVETVSKADALEVVREWKRTRTKVRTWWNTIGGARG